MNEFNGYAMILDIRINLTCREKPYAPTYKQSMACIECGVIPIADTEREQDALKRNSSKSSVRVCTLIQIC